VTFIIIASFVIALGLGIYVGLGAPGFKGKGRVDRVVEPGRARRLNHKHLDWMRPRR
jgi:hypothetical protein